MKKISLRTIAVLGLLTALEIIISRFLSISTESLKLGFSFVVVAFAAREYGVLGGAVVGGAGDLLGAILFPIGPYFPGFTLTAALCGTVYGILFKTYTVKKIVAAQLINNFILGGLLNTLWISVLYGAPFMSLIPLRMLGAVVTTVVGIPLLYFMNKYMPKLKLK